MALLISELNGVALARHSSDVIDGDAAVLQLSGPYRSISISEREGSLSLSSSFSVIAVLPRRLALPPEMAGVVSSAEAEAAAAVTDDSKKLTMGWKRIFSLQEAVVSGQGVNM